MRWCAAQQNWDKIHYDNWYAVHIAKLPGTVVNGALKQQFLAQFLAHEFPASWLWRLGCRFEGIDLVGSSLEVRGHITQVTSLAGIQFVQVELEIWNLDSGAMTTSGSAVVLVLSQREIVPTRMPAVTTPFAWRLNTAIRSADPSTPAIAVSKLGDRLESLESAYAVSLSRLRLFAEAIMDLPDVHYDPCSDRARLLGGVVAPPLFPLHGLELLPGSMPLSNEQEAMGREGVGEIGRDMGRLFGFPIAVNGGIELEIHSLARAGERVCAESTLAGAYARTGRRSGPMMFVETLNRYREAGGRPLLTERQTMICMNGGAQ